MSAPTLPPQDGPTWPTSEPVHPGIPQNQTNGMAVASLVLGILWLFWLGSVLALIFGYIARSQIDSSGGRQSGRGLAIAGIVLGWVGVGVLVVAMILLAVGALSDGESDSATPVADDTAQVEQLLDRYSKATRDKDYQAICDEVYATELLQRIRAAGLPCEVALRTGLEDRRNPQLEVLGVEVDGSEALARVRSSASGEPPAVDLVRLIKQGASWRLASLSEPGEAASP